MNNQTGFIFTLNDVHDFDELASDFIVTGLEKFKKIEKSTVAPTLDSDIDSYTNEENQEAWNTLIDKMIFGFSLHEGFTEKCPVELETHVENDCVYSKPKQPINQEEYNSWLKRRDEYMKKLNCEILEGRTLFITYFDHLWS